MAPKFLILLAVLSISALSLSPSHAQDSDNNGLVMNFYKEACPQAEDIIKEQVKLLYKRHKNTAFSWLRNIFHDCAVQVINLTFFLFSASCMVLDFLIFNQRVWSLFLGRVVMLHCCWTPQEGACLKRRQTEALV